MRRRRRSLVPLLVLLLPVLLVAGIWLGGHPTTLPSFMRDALVGDDEAQVYDEAMKLIQDDYYRKVDRDKLLDKSLGAAVDSLNDQFSNYFSPADYKDFRQATEGQFEGVGMTVEETSRGLRVLTVYDGSPAKRGGLEPGGPLMNETDSSWLRPMSSLPPAATMMSPARIPARLAGEPS